MPRLEIGKPPARVAGAADDQREQHQSDGVDGTPGPAPERGEVHRTVVYHVKLKMLADDRRESGSWVKLDLNREGTLAQSL